MCGILGIVSSEVIQAPIAASISSMACAIAHRGPDDQGCVFINRQTGHNVCKASCSPTIGTEAQGHTSAPIDPTDGTQVFDVVLGHYRFAIICTSHDGYQPFWDIDSRICVITNGELYNYLELRLELESAGHQFRTKSDTEVLVEAYREWGDRCFEKFNGMWATAIYDFGRRELILCRDRTGERPLYWARRPEGIYFASEIKALLTLPSFRSERRVNDQAVYNFLYQAVSDLDSKVFFESIESVPAATVIHITITNDIRTHRFWRMPDTRFSATTASSISDTCDELRFLLRDSVAMRLRADVPVNVSLSGGMDSSSVVAMAAGLRPGGLDTYTVRFAEAEWNEWPFADAVARKFGVSNLVLDPPSDWVWDHLERFVYSMEEPFHAPDLLPDHVIRRMLAARGFKVTLSGIGGDELFAGYEHYRRFHALDLKRSGRTWAAVRELVCASDTTRGRAVLQLLRGRWHKFRHGRDQGMRNGFMEGAIRKPAGLRLSPLPDSCEERLRADIEWSLLPYWLRAGDKSSMAIPIEVRYPFLDHRLIEFAARLPISYLIRDGWLKWILRKAMEDLLPSEIVWRRRKMGFPFPITEWLTGAIPKLRLIFEEMDNPYLPQPFWFHRLPDAIDHDPWLVWRALSLELWHRHFIRGLPVLPDRLVAELPSAGQGARTGVAT